MKQEGNYAIGRYIIMEIDEDGPNCLEGRKTYRSMQDARSGVEDYLRNKRSHVRLTIMKIEGDFWLDPNPQILTNREEPAPAMAVNK